MNRTKPNAIGTGFSKACLVPSTRIRNRAEVSREPRKMRFNLEGTDERGLNAPGDSPPAVLPATDSAFAVL